MSINTFIVYTTWLVNRHCNSLHPVDTIFQSVGFLVIMGKNAKRNKKTKQRPKVTERTRRKYHFSMDPRG